MDNTSIENKFYSLLSRKLSGDATAEDLLQLQELLSQHPSFQFLYDQMHIPGENEQVDQQQIIGAFAAHYVNKMEHFPSVPQKIHAAGERPAARKRTMNILLWGAAAAAILTGALFLGQHLIFSGHKNGRLHEVATRIGAKSTVTLPDGTTLVLNSGSRVTYDDAFGKEHRNITLEGEAFFDVSQDVLQPFIVHTGKGDVRVLGTAFNVRAYEGEPNFETSLIRGKVEVLANKGANRNFILHPSQKLVIRETTASKEAEGNTEAGETVMLTYVTRKDSLVAETSWIDNKLLFINKPLSEIAEELERRFHITVQFKSDKTKNYRYTGVFDDADLHEILEILKLSKKINYNLTKQELIID